MRGRTVGKVSGAFSFVFSSSSWKGGYNIIRYVEYESNNNQPVGKSNISIPSYLLYDTRKKKHWFVRG